MCYQYILLISVVYCGYMLSMSMDIYKNVNRYKVLGKPANHMGFRQAQRRVSYLWISTRIYLDTLIYA